MGFSPSSHPDRNNSGFTSISLVHLLVDTMIPWLFGFSWGSEPEENLKVKFHIYLLHTGDLHGNAWFLLLWFGPLTVAEKC